MRLSTGRYQEKKKRKYSENTLQNSKRRHKKDYGKEKKRKTQKKVEILV